VGQLPPPQVCVLNVPKQRLLLRREPSTQVEVIVSYGGTAAIQIEVNFQIADGLQGWVCKLSCGGFVVVQQHDLLRVLAERPWEPWPTREVTEVHSLVTLHMHVVF
jgi:hypothetical protein